MKVLIACEFSEIVKYAFLLRGHDAHSCDYLPGERGLPNHHQCDVRELLNEYWDMMIVFDPCTYQCNSGVRWLHERPERWELLRESCEFTRKLLDAPIDLIVRENPIPHKYAVSLIGRKYDQIIQPRFFGEPYLKATCFWLKNVPPLIPTNIIPKDKCIQAVWKEPPSHDRWKKRSRTYQGIADAMAEQWGSLT